MSTNKKPRNSKPFSYQASQSLPKLGAVKTQWELAKLYYTSEQAKPFHNDVAHAKATYQRFVKRWSTRNFTSSATQLANALADYNTLMADPRLSKPGRYLAFRLALNSDDTKAKKAQARLHKEMRPLQDAMVFFRLRIGAIPKAKQRQYLTSSVLKPYHYYLSRVFISAQHNLSEAEEKIINLKSHQSYDRWVDAVDTILSNRSIRFNSQDIPIQTALASLTNYPQPQREKLWAGLMTEMKAIGEFAEHEFNAIITDVRTEDELRGYAKPYSATALGYQDTEKSIESLVEVMTTEGFALSRKFYKLKAQYHGQDTLHYTQKYDPIGQSQHIPFAQAVEICRDVFYGLKTEYGEIFDRMLSNGQIDVYPQKGKRGGAFMSEAIGHPTQVMLNHTDDLSSLRTLAHEMGHAIHAERGKQQPAIYQGHSITTAETASTLFENLLFQKLLTQADDTLKLELLHDKLAQNTATMQRQIAFFNCELEIHNTIHAQGAMTNAELAACMQRHLKAYLGPAVAVTPEDGYSYVYIPHLRYGFYVYTYCFGLLMSNQMARQYEADPRYITKIDTFLSLAESKTVADIFRAIGFNIEREDTFAEALVRYKEDVQAFAKLVKAKTR
jgi:oligoendopeptidase F